MVSGSTGTSQSSVSKFIRSHVEQHRYISRDPYKHSQALAPCAQFSVCRRKYLVLLFFQPHSPIIVGIACAILRSIRE